MTMMSWSLGTCVFAWAMLIRFLWAVSIQVLPTEMVSRFPHFQHDWWGQRNMRILHIGRRNFSFLKHKSLIVSFHDFPGEKFTPPPNLHVTILSQVLPLRIRQRPLNGLIGRCWFQHCCWCWHLYWPVGRLSVFFSLNVFWRLIIWDDHCEFH